MTTIPELKEEIAAYLQRPAPDFIVNGIDLLYKAINQAHQYAQMQYDFEMMRCSVDVPIDLKSGAVLSPSYLDGTTSNVTIKKVRHVYLSDTSGGLRPINFSSREPVNADLGIRWKGEYFNTRNVYPQPYSGCDVPGVYQMGQRVYCYPADPGIFGPSPVSTMMDVYRYFPDYDDDEDNDFLLQFGDDFMKWAAICRLNFILKEFVNRQEGNLAPPVTERDAAWANLLSWDSTLTYSADTSLTLD